LILNQISFLGANYFRGYLQLFPVVISNQADNQIDVLFIGFRERQLYLAVLDIDHIVAQMNSGNIAHIDDVAVVDAYKLRRKCVLKVL